LLDTAAALGLSETEFWDMLPREFARRVRAHRERVEREEDAAWGRALLVTNHLRSLLAQNAGKKGRSIKPLTLEQLKRRPGEVPPEHSKEAWIALCERIDRA